MLHAYNQGCSGVGTAFPHLFALVTLLEDLDFGSDCGYAWPNAI